jgi:MFS family permease
VSSLDGSSIEGSWAGTSYLLTSAVLQPLVATVSESLGRQQLLIACVAFFTLGNLMCSLARGFPLLLAGRSFQGAGGGGVTTMAQVMFCDIVPLRERPKYFSMVLLAWSVGSILGPVTGGLLVEHLSWRWCFYINFPFCGMGLLAALSLLRLQPVRNSTVAPRLKDFDWLSATLFVGSLTAGLVGISWGGVQFPWTSAATLLPIAGGASCLVVFFVRMRFAVTVRSTKILFTPRESAKQATRFLSTIKGSWSMAAAFYCALSNGLVVSGAFLTSMIAH